MKSCLFLLAVVPLIGSPVYTITNIGGIGGPRSEASAISTNGLVAGTAVDAAGGTHGLLYNGAAQVLGNGTEIRGINSSGNAVGTANGSATIWQNGSETILSADGSYGLGISDSGYVTGAAVMESGQMHAFLYFNGRLVDVGTLGGSWSAGYAVNDFGQVAGSSEKRGGSSGAFLWDERNGMRRLDGPRGSLGSRAFALNSGGSVAGATLNSRGFYHAAVWDTDAAVLDIGTLGGGHSYAYGINDSGSVVGLSLDALGQERAFLWSDGLLFDLNTLVDAPDWVLTGAYGVNANGQIVGAGLYKGISSAFLLNPDIDSSGGDAPGDADLASVPEPASTLPILALAAVGAFFRRRIFHTPLN